MNYLRNRVNWLEKQQIYHKILYSPDKVQHYAELWPYLYSHDQIDRCKAISFGRHRPLSVLNQDCILFIGDSHADFFSRDLHFPNLCIQPLVRCQWLGPITLYRVLRDGLLSIVPCLPKIYPQYNGTIVIVLSFGEIDIRRHWHKHTNIEQLETYAKIMASKYLCEVTSWIGRIRINNGHKSIKIMLMAPPPPVSINSIPDPDIWGSSYPRGSDCFRALATKFFLSALLDEVKLHREPLNILHVNNQVSDHSGCLKPEYCDGTVHCINTGYLLSNIISICL